VRGRGFSRVCLQRVRLSLCFLVPGGYTYQCVARRGVARRGVRSEGTRVSGKGSHGCIVQGVQEGYCEIYSRGTRKVVHLVYRRIRQGGESPLVSCSVPTSAASVGSATGGGGVSSGGASVVRVATVVAGVGGVEEVVEGGGVGTHGRGPARVGRIRAHAGGMVDGLADQAFEQFVGSASTVICRDEDGVADDGSPVREGCVVFGGGKDVDVPRGVGFSFARAYVFLFHEVEAAHYDGVAEVSEDVLDVHDQGRGVVAEPRDEPSDLLRGVSAGGRGEQGLADYGCDLFLRLGVGLVEEKESLKGRGEAVGGRRVWDEKGHQLGGRDEPLGGGLVWGWGG
jgi:hypothetical protein